MKQVEAARAGRPMSVLTPPVQQQAMQVAYLVTHLLEDMALVIIINVEGGNGFEMRRTLVQQVEPDLGSHKRAVFVAS